MGGGYFASKMYKSIDNNDRQPSIVASSVVGQLGGIRGRGELLVIEDCRLSVPSDGGFI